MYGTDTRAGFRRVLGSGIIQEAVFEFLTLKMVGESQQIRRIDRCRELNLEDSPHFEKKSGISKLIYG